MDYSRIAKAIDTQMLKDLHIVGIGAGGAYCLYESLVRSGIGKLTVLDIDTVDDVNICRQGFSNDQIGRMKVESLGDHLLNLNPDLDYRGLTTNFLDWSDEHLDRVFKNCDLMLFMTDSFKAQAFGNELALKYNKPAIWGGFYEKSECAEIVFYIPKVTPACFRCVVAPRYEAQGSSRSEIKVASDCNTMFHSQLIDSMIGMLSMAILHNNTTGYTFSEWFGDYFDRNLIQFKVNPDYESGLFDRMLQATEGRALLFNAIWQQINTCGCPDCKK